MTTTAPSATASAAAGSLKGVVAAPTSVCTIDGTAGKLIYRGYLIEDLAAHATFEEVVYLLWEGELPTASQLDSFTRKLAAGRALPEALYQHLRLIPNDAAPLAVLRSCVSLLAQYDAAQIAEASS